MNHIEKRVMIAVAAKLDISTFVPSYE